MSPQHPGMLELDVTLTLQRISKHLRVYLTKCMVEDGMNVCQALKSRLGFFKVFPQAFVWRRFLTATHPQVQLKDYISFCLLALETVQCCSHQLTLDRSCKVCFAPSFSTPPHQGSSFATEREIWPRDYTKFQTILKQTAPERKVRCTEIHASPMVIKGSIPQVSKTAKRPAWVQQPIPSKKHRNKVRMA